MKNFSFNQDTNNIILNSEDFELLLFNLNSKFYNIKFNLYEVYISQENNDIGDVINHFNIILQYDIVDNKLMLELNTLNLINELYQEWLKYIQRYLKYKYIISKFKNDEDYYCNYYDWNFILLTNINNEIIPIYKQINKNILEGDK